MAGLAASTLAYLKRLGAPARPHDPSARDQRCRRLGWRGSFVENSANTTFLAFVPWLLLSGTLLFAFGNTSVQSPAPAPWIN